MQTLHEVGYAAWCARGECYRCKFKGCECLHHSGGVADAEIVAICKENAVNRGWMGPKCQMAKHPFCKKTGCACRCHASGEEGVVKIIKEEAPLASEEHILELQERVYAASADVQNAVQDFKETAANMAKGFNDFHGEVKKVIDDYDQRLRTMEKAKKLEVHVPVEGKPGKTKKVAELGAVHKDFEELLHDVTLQTKGAVYVVGPAGGGKTFIGRQIHLAMGRKPELYFPMSVGLQTTKADLMGYTSPTTGECFHSPLYNTHVLGGTGLLDEVDAGNAGVMTIANAVLAAGAGDLIQFGCKCPPMPRHPDARFIVAANTFGKGADHLYVGRNQLDEATRKRFIFFPLEYDWDLVRQFTGDIDGFTTYVERLAECAAELKLRVVISPRQAEFGCSRLAAGQPRERVEYKVLWADMDLDDRKKLLATYERKYPPEPKFHCGVPGCEWKFFTEEELIAHDKKEHAWACPVCESIFMTWAELVNHQNETNHNLPEAGEAEVANPGVVYTSCPKCGSNKISNNLVFNAERRKLNQTARPDYKCDECKWHVWPSDYVWPPKGSSTKGYWKE